VKLKSRPPSDKSAFSFVLLSFIAPLLTVPKLQATFFPKHVLYCIILFLIYILHVKPCVQKQSTALLLPKRVLQEFPVRVVVMEPCLPERVQSPS